MLHPTDLISLPLRVSITDGRQIKGILIALDDDCNILLSNAVELRNENGKWMSRELRLVSIRKFTISKIEADSSSYNDTVKMRDQNKTANKKGVVII
ncbi:Hypothetical protein PP7435_CHR3-1776 [Komagataella phaffii CBS 7435]|uniref:Sm domain-containing protein n=2 Tax=Komagataella phaffii TaxID=460519 RepID=C4R5J8_KOMPG|nr:Hypothetical protein PAS_chr3_0780 [Komagataella phaffii GS115]CAH2449381.1 Hypothetical protein BQ9382_C3-2215 [Komagataella phaffii CBS 7435]CAY70834.1 Hypothetical protein PAS_chr3_0780 [Komagataella phaffii GS115]SCV12197.1 Hypothetical protein PP7435_CHR3-1776 [Komagataella phaffii CBS 7435]